MKHIHIEQLNIRLTNIPVQTAHSATEGLGRQVLERLARGDSTRKAHGTIEVPALNAGRLQTPRSMASHELRQAIAQMVAQAIAESATRSSGQ